MLFCNRAVRGYHEEHHILRFGVGNSYAIVPPNVSPVVVELKSQGVPVRLTTVFEPISGPQYLA